MTIYYTPLDLKESTLAELRRTVTAQSIIIELPTRFSQGIIIHLITLPSASLYVNVPTLLILDCHHAARLIAVLLF